MSDGDRPGNDGLRAQTDRAGLATDDRYFQTLDMLRDPPPVGRVDLLRRSHKIKNVIYKKPSNEKGKEKDGGVEQIMQQARQTLGKISEEAAKEKTYLPDPEDFRMRWIHLPLNNVRWQSLIWIPASD